MERIKTIDLLRTSTAWDGSALPDYPAGPAELLIRRMVFPVGHKTGWHHHNVINYGIVVQGELTIVRLDPDGTRLEKTFHAGEPIVEVVGAIHRGENRGRQSVILDMFYVSSPDLEVTVQHHELTDIRVQASNPTSDTLMAHSRKTGEAKPLDLPRPTKQRLFRLISTIGTNTYTRRQIMALLKLKESSRKSFIDNYLQPAYNAGYIDFAYPSSPNTPVQAYRLTAYGIDVLRLLEQS